MFQLQSPGLVDRAQRKTARTSRVPVRPDTWAMWDRWWTVSCKCTKADGMCVSCDWTFCTLTWDPQIHGADSVTRTLSWSLAQLTVLQLFAERTPANTVSEMYCNDMMRMNESNVGLWRVGVLTCEGMQECRECWGGKGLICLGCNSVHWPRWTQLWADHTDSDNVRIP